LLYFYRKGDDISLGRLKNNTKDRVGIVRFNRYNSRMIIEEYNSPTDIWVKFIDTNEKTNTTWQNFCNGKVRSLYDKTVFGVGYIGEGKYKAYENKLPTPQYKSWSSTLQRCYYEKYLVKQPTYKGCTVIEDWHNFQVFAEWYDQNYYHIEGERIHLDKDILLKGNKLYSPETCIFVPFFINNLFSKTSRGKFPIGVSFNENNKNFIVQCTNDLGKVIYLGSYNDSFLAYKEYKKFKEKIIQCIADKYKDKIPVPLFNAMMSYTVDIRD
jgi:hypothetical protein